MALVGIDEVGRGSLAGPVVLASVCLADSYPDKTLPYGEDQSSWYNENPNFKTV